MHGTSSSRYAQVGARVARVRFCGDNFEAKKEIKKMMQECQHIDPASRSIILDDYLESYFKSALQIRASQREFLDLSRKIARSLGF